MEGKRRRWTPQQKVEILREHLKNGVSVSEISERYGIHPNQFYQWEKELFEGALESFSTKHKVNGGKGARERYLEERLRKKEEVILWLTEENLKLKKTLIIINYYNHERLHSSIDYVTPYDMLIGRKEEILMVRDKKLAEARRRRIEFYNQNTNLFQMSILSNSR